MKHLFTNHILLQLFGIIALIFAGSWAYFQYFSEASVTIQDDQNKQTTQSVTLDAQKTFTGGYDDAWSKRLKITIRADQIDSDLTDFPVYVDLSTLPDEFFANVKSDGGDIRITKDDGITEVPREIVAVDTTAKTGELHFKASGTLSSSADTEFYIYYGNSGASDYATDATYGAEAVWTENFALVSHAGCGCDSTGTFTLTANGGIVAGDSTSGKIGNATTFGPAVEQKYFISDNTTLWNTLLDYDKAYTFSAFMRPTVVDPGVPMFLIAKIKENTDYKGAYMLLNGGELQFGFHEDNSPLSTIAKSSGTGVTFSNATWAHIAGTYDGSNDYTGLELYVNGVKDTTATDGSTGVTPTIGFQHSDPLLIGARGWGIPTEQREFVGLLDEIRISSVARSADWISAEYTNQNTPGTFYRVGKEESKDTSIVDGLIAHWTFDGRSISGSTVYDIGGNNGTLFNTPSPLPGIIGQALSFDGVDQYMSVGDIPLTIKSISFWIQTPSLTDQKIINIDGTDQIELNSLGDIVATSFPNATVFIDGGEDATLPDTNWHHVVITDTTGVLPSTFELGRVGTSYLNGSLDDVRLYDRVLAPGDIEQTGKLGTKTKINTSKNNEITDGLVGLWSFDGPDIDWSDTGAEIKDRSGNGNDGNASTSGMDSSNATIGKIGQGLEFDGVGEYIDVGNSMIPTASDFTVSLWQSIALSETGHRVLFSQNSLTGGIIFYGVTTHGTANEQMRLWVEGNEVGVGSDIRDGEWHHIVVTRSGDNWIVYLDANIDASGVAGDYTGGFNTFIGNRTDDASMQYNGSLDDVRIYNYALSAEEVQALYALGR